MANPSTAEHAVVLKVGSLIRAYPSIQKVRPRNPACTISRLLTSTRIFGVYLSLEILTTSKRHQSCPAMAQRQHELTARFLHALDRVRHPLHRHRGDDPSSSRQQQNGAPCESQIPEGSDTSTAEATVSQSIYPHSHPSNFGTCLGQVANLAWKL